MYVCMYAMCMPDACRIQKRALNSLNWKDDHEPPCGCWKLRPGALQEQQVLLSTEPSIYSPLWLYNSYIYILYHFYTFIVLQWTFIRFISELKFLRFYCCWFNKWLLKFYDFISRNPMNSSAGKGYFGSNTNAIFFLS